MSASLPAATRARHVVLFFAIRYHEPPLTLLLVADAFVLALFTMLGTRKGLAFGTAPAIAIAMGVITGVFGGMASNVGAHNLAQMLHPVGRAFSIEIGRAHV